MTDTTREMSYQGFEKDRETLKYQCPAAAGGYECQGRNVVAAVFVSQLSMAASRVSLETNRRIFTPIPRSSLKCKSAYALRSSVERVNGRLDRVLGFELHTIRGQKKMETRMGLALVIQLAMALARIRAHQGDLLRSIVLPLCEMVPAVA